MIFFIKKILIIRKQYIINTPGLIDILKSWNYINIFNQIAVYCVRGSLIYTIIFKNCF